MPAGDHLQRMSHQHLLYLFVPHHLLVASILVVLFRSLSQQRLLSAELMTNPNYLGRSADALQTSKCLE